MYLPARGERLTGSRIRENDCARAFKMTPVPLRRDGCPLQNTTAFEIGRDGLRPAILDQEGPQPLVAKAYDDGLLRPTLSKSLGYILAGATQNTGAGSAPSPPPDRLF